MSRPRQTTVYLEVEILLDLQREAARQDRSLSWMVKRAWEIAKKELRRVPRPPAEEKASDEKRRPEHG